MAWNDSLWNTEIRQRILAKLTGYRYEHTLGVERAAIALAEKYGADPQKAACAACFHDITKRLSCEEQLNLCDKYGIIPNDVEAAEWKMLHGVTAAAIASHEYHLPQDIVEAIACHTAGRANMTILDKILYLADYIDDTRSFDGVETARALAWENMDKALLYCFDQSLEDLVKRRKLIHVNTVLARNELVANGVTKYQIP